MLLLLKAGINIVEELHDDDFRHIPVIDILQISWDFGLAGVRLTSVGSIVGGLVLGQLKGKDYGLPDWK